MNILLIEDERKLASLIGSGLRQADHRVDQVHDGNTGLQLACTGAYDLILLDLMLPGQNGFEILKNLKTFRNETPVIIISALNETANVIEGLDLGAVDYLKKPVDFDELLARIRVLQRQKLAQSDTTLVLDDLSLDVLTHEVKRAGKPVLLSNREFRLLEFMMRNPERVISRAQLLEHVWGIHFDLSSNVVEVHIYQLRKKVDTGFPAKLIHTVVGRGYQFRSRPFEENPA